MLKIISCAGDEHVIKPTIFPDKTSQVWKIPVQFLPGAFCDGTDKIIWNFEKEEELIHLLQLVTLLNPNGVCSKQVDLHIPYLPYARQDKPISNETTFSLHTFCHILKTFRSYFKNITTLDAHNAVFIKNLIDSSSPNEFIQFAINETSCKFICFPDEGASKRGYPTFGKHFFCLEKKRDPKTGDILGMFLENDLYNLKDKRILIVDDICDGGKTFIQAAKLIYAEGAAEVHLYVTHGIFSKGLQVLKDAGIKRIFTANGEINE